MLHAAISFFLIGLVAFILGAYNIAGISIDLGRTLLIIFAVLAVISFFFNLVTGKKT